MNTIKKVFLLLAAYMAINCKAQGPCNASNSPTFQLTTSQATLATYDVCGVEISIVNAATNPPGGPVSYSLFAPGQPGPIIPTPTVATIAGIWTVTVRDNSNNCMTSQIVVVNLLPAPTLSVVATNTLLCSGHMATLTASGANSYTWHTGAPTASISVMPATPTLTYSVKGTGSNGCANITSGAINVNPSPNITATANQNSVCVNQSIQLTAQGANTYTWNNNATGNQYTTSAFTATGNLTYTVQIQGTDNAGCVGANFVSVTVLVQTCETIGVPEYSNSNQIKIYPNPVNDILNIEFENRNTEIKMVDFLGKEMLRAKNTKQINVGELPEGVYFIFISNDKNEKVTGKFLISR